MNAAAEQVFSELALRWSLPALRLDAHGCARLQVDQRWTVHLEVSDADGVVHLYGTVAPAPASPGEAYWRTLLEANLFGQATGGATLALDAQQAEIVLCDRVPLPGLGAQALESAIERFLQALEHWTDRLGRATEGPQGGLAQAAALGAPVPATGFLRA